MSTEQNITEITILLKSLIEKLGSKSRLEKLTEEMKENPDLRHLFIDDQDTKYDCSKFTTSEGFNHSQKCVILTFKFEFLEEYIDLYLTKNPEVIDYKNVKGWTALMIASRNSNYTSTEKTVQILLDHNANVNLQSNDGQTALMYASRNSKYHSTEKTVKMLLDHNADVNAKNIYGTTALIHCAGNTKQESSLYTIQMLLTHGADINLQNADGNTALMCTIKHIPVYSSEETVKLLLDHNANIYLKDERGSTALSLSLQSTIGTIKMILGKINDCDIEIHGKKLIKYLWGLRVPVELIHLVVQKGAKLTDIIDERVIEYFNTMRSIGVTGSIGATGNTGSTGNTGFIGATGNTGSI